MIHIAIIATNKYFPLGVRFIKKFEKHSDQKVRFHFFSNMNPADYLPSHVDLVFYRTEHNSWVDATNSKFDNIMKVQADNSDYIFYFDADTGISRDFSVNWFLGDSVAGEHFGNKGFLSGNKGYDRNSESKAYIPEDSQLECMYFYGAFFGGRSNFVKYFCETLIDWQQKDKAMNYEPAVNDESYINRFFHYSPPLKIVKSSDFAFNISDKGGLDNTRKIEDLPQEMFRKMLYLKDVDYDIADGEIRI